MFAFSETQNIT